MGVRTGTRAQPSTLPVPGDGAAITASSWLHCRARTGPRMMRSSCKLWTTTMPGGWHLSSCARAWSPPSWTRRANPR